MVFTAKPEDSQLIDFDFGGKSQVCRYQPGYQKHLADGQRNGKPFGVVLKCDDVYSLIAAFQKVLIGPASDKLQRLILAGESQLSIDGLIGTLNEIVKSEIAVPHQLMAVLVHDTKLEKLSPNHLPRPRMAESYHQSSQDSPVPSSCNIIHREAVHCYYGSGP
jgi:hypothetical protein